MSDQLQVSVLGSFQLQFAGQLPIHLPYDKLRALIAYLLVERSQLHYRDSLAALLWPDKQQKSARQSLRQALSTLRDVVGDKSAEIPLFLINASTVQCNPAASVIIDCEQLEKALIPCPHTSNSHFCDDCLQRWEEAVALYKGNFLRGLGAIGSAEFDTWLGISRERLHRQIIAALDQLTTHFEACGQFDKGLHYARRQLELEPWREEAHQTVIRLLARSGLRSQALRHFAVCAQALQDELGIGPSENTLALVEQVRRMRVGLTNLPAQPTPFIGRKSEQAKIISHLSSPSCRIVTLTGLGGSGKSRLALATAETLAQGSYLDGVWHIELDPSNNKSAQEQVCRALVHFNLLPATSSDWSIKRIGEHLADREMLLVIDGYEPNGKRANWMASLLRASKRVKLLVTARESLGLRWEQRIVVQGLAEDDALALLTGIAERIRPNATQDHATFKQICASVDHMPLAIEIAAEHLSYYNPQQIADSIIEDSSFLTAALNDRPDTQFSIQTVIEQEWQRMAPDVQQMLCQLAVFEGSFTREAVAVITQSASTLLNQLITANLVSIVDDDSNVTRYGLSMLLRRYANSRLQANRALTEATRQRHQAYYTARLAKFADALHASARVNTIFAEIENDLANYSLAWRHALAQRNSNALRNALPMWVAYYVMQGQGQFALHQLNLTMMTLNAKSRFDQPQSRVIQRSVELLLHLEQVSIRLGDETLARDYQRMADALLEAKPMRPFVTSFVLDSAEISQR